MVFSGFFSLGLDGGNESAGVEVVSVALSRVGSTAVSLPVCVVFKESMSWDIVAIL